MKREWRMGDGNGVGEFLTRCHKNVKGNNIKIESFRTSRVKSFLMSFLKHQKVCHFLHTFTKYPSPSASPHHTKATTTHFFTSCRILHFSHYVVPSVACLVVLAPRFNFILFPFFGCSNNVSCNFQYLIEIN